MNFRFRPELMSLETRENPSVPGVDPIGGDAPPPVDTPPAAAPTDTTTPTTGSPLLTIIALTTELAVNATQTTDPLLQNNSIYNIPLVP
jgi:hypothetical protein